MPYTAVEADSARERYIRVAQIDIVISEGIMNICRVARMHKKPDFYTADKNVRRRTHLTGKSVLFMTRLKKRETTVQIQKYEHLRGKLAMGKEAYERTLDIPLA